MGCAATRVSGVPARGILPSLPRPATARGWIPKCPRPCPQKPPQFRDRGPRHDRPRPPLPQWPLYHHRGRLPDAKPRVPTPPPPPGFPRGGDAALPPDPWVFVRVREHLVVGKSRNDVLKARSAYLRPRSSRDGVRRGAGVARAVQSRYWSSRRLATRRERPPPLCARPAAPRGTSFGRVLGRRRTRRQTRVTLFTLLFS